MREQRRRARERVCSAKWLRWRYDATMMVVMVMTMTATTASTMMTL